MTPVRVLVVDDQEPFRRAAADVIASTTTFVLVGTAVTGEESLEAVARLAPDLVLMDVHLPGIDGLESTRRIRRFRPVTAVLLLSTYPDRDFASDAMECGAVGYLAKAAFGPDRLDSLWATVAGDIRDTPPLDEPTAPFD